MQPGTNPDDLHTILSRFHTWADKQPGQSNGNGASKGHGADGIRTLTYEEALAQHRSQHAPPRRTRPSPRGVGETGTAVAAAPGPASAQPPGAVQGQPLESPSPQPPMLGLSPKAAADTARADRFNSSREEQAFQENGRARAQERPIPAQITVSTPRQSSKSAGKVSRAKSAVKVARQSKPAVAETGSGQISVTTAKATSTAARLKSEKRSASIAVPEKKNPEFRQVLVKSVRTADQKGNKTKRIRKRTEPERARRITTRFSAAEERRLEKAAERAGMTVSAYLRKCALAAEQAEAARPGTHRPAVPAKRRKAGSAELSMETQLFAPPASTSLVGGWLSLLRQRLLSSPARFSERA
jgi:hypothetical protein